MANDHGIRVPEVADELGARHLSQWVVREIELLTPSCGIESPGCGRPHRLTDAQVVTLAALVACFTGEFALQAPMRLALYTSVHSAATIGAPAVMMSGGYGLSLTYYLDLDLPDRIRKAQTP